MIVKERKFSKGKDGSIISISIEGYGGYEIDNLFDIEEVPMIRITGNNSNHWDASPLSHNSIVMLTPAEVVKIAKKAGICDNTALMRKGYLSEFSGDIDFE